MEKTKYYKDNEMKAVYKTVEYEDGSMKPFVFNGKEWINCTVGHLAQAQWNGRQIDETEVLEFIKEEQKGKSAP